MSTEQSRASDRARTALKRAAETPEEREQRLSYFRNRGAKESEKRKERYNSDPAFREYRRDIARRSRLRRPDVFVAATHGSRARNAGVEGSFTGAEWIALKRRYGFRCIACGVHVSVLARMGRTLTPDHVIPIVRRVGILNAIGNIQPLCHGPSGCNNKKNAQHTDYRPSPHPNCLKEKR